MDLREKPGKVQTVMEFLLRIRLISVVAMVIAIAAFTATKWQEMVSLTLGASEAFCMWIAGLEDVVTAWQSGQFLAVSGIAAVVLFFVFGGVRAGFASLISIVASLGALFLLAGNDQLPLMFFGGLSLVAVIALILIKLSVACGLFPFVLGWCFFTGLMVALPEALQPSWMVWAVLSTLGFASVMSLSVVAGKNLGQGMPQAGALVKAAKQMILPVILSSFVALGSLVFDMAGNESTEILKNNIWGGVLYLFVYNIWFFVLVYPSMSFAPWERLRAGSRRVEMKEKKKKTVSKGKKK
ncbi:MAG: hypothetical protein MJY85_08985 [Fibrobacter sp.]|nr:hypothetical protein [Fibrobacter sp.]